MDDIRRYRVGTLLSLIMEKSKSIQKAERNAEAKAKGKDVRMATQADIDALAR